MVSSDEDDDTFSLHDSSGDSNFVGSPSESESEEVIDNSTLVVNDFVKVQFKSKN